MIVNDELKLVFVLKDEIAHRPRFWLREGRSAPVGLATRHVVVGPLVAPRDIIVTVQIDALVHAITVTESFECASTIFAFQDDCAIACLIGFNESHAIWVDHGDEVHLRSLQQV